MPPANTAPDQTASVSADDRPALAQLRTLVGRAGIDLRSAKVGRSSSRFCLGVEHGDYNGTELFGVGTDLFIWIACCPNNTGPARLFSGNSNSPSMALTASSKSGRLRPAFPIDLRGAQRQAPLPVVRASDLDEPANRQRWLVESRWARAGVGFIGGAPRCCKSWLALDIALSVASAVVQPAAGVSRSSIRAQLSPSSPKTLQALSVGVLAP